MARPHDGERAARLRAAGLRVTRPRLSVLEALERLGGHRSVDELGRALDAGGVPLPLTTIYNVVEDLSRERVIVAADVGPGRARYEVADRWHHHFVCRSCGRLIDVDCAVGARPCLEADLPGAEVEEAAVLFRGRCPDCAGPPCS